MKWHQADRAAHDRQLGSPQPFRLAGDGVNTQRAAARLNRSDPMLGPRLAEARYRDWLAQRDRRDAESSE